MTKPQQKRQKRAWVEYEDNIIINFKTKDRNLRWTEIIKQGNLKGRDEKSCSHRWNNYLRPEITNKGEFTPQEDDIIIQQMSLPQNSWKSMAKHHLPGRAANAIKNRWNRHLKKRHATISDLRRDLLYPEEHLMHDEASDHSVRGDDVEALMAEFASLIPQVDTNEKRPESVSDPRRPLPNHVLFLMDDEASDHSVRGDDVEALMAEFASLIPEVDKQPLMNDKTSDDSLLEAEIDALISSWITEDDQNPISLIFEHPAEEITKLRVIKILSTCL